MDKINSFVLFLNIFIFFQVVENVDEKILVRKEKFLKNKNGRNSLENFSDAMIKTNSKILVCNRCKKECMEINKNIKEHGYLSEKTQSKTIETIECCNTNYKPKTHNWENYHCEDYSNYRGCVVYNACKAWVWNVFDKNESCCEYKIPSKIIDLIKYLYKVENLTLYESNTESIIKSNTVVLKKPDTIIFKKNNVITETKQEYNIKNIFETFKPDTPNKVTKLSDKTKYIFKTSEPDTITLEPDTITLEPDTVTFEPDTITLEPDTVTFEPDTVTSEPDTVTLEPDTVTFEPDTITLEPDTVTFEPNTITLEPDTVTSEQYIYNLSSVINELDTKSKKLINILNITNDLRVISKFKKNFNESNRKLIKSKFSGFDIFIIVTCVGVMVFTIIIFVIFMFKIR